MKTVNICGIYIIDNLLVSTDEETPLLSILDDEITKKTVEKVLNSTDERIKE